MREVQKITVENQGAYVMSFYVKSPGDIKTKSSGTLAYGEYATIDLKDYPKIRPGATVWPRVDVTLGPDMSGDHVRYQPNGQVAVYRCHGTVFDPKIKLLPGGAELEAAAADGEASEATPSEPAEQVAS